MERERSKLSFRLKPVLKTQRAEPAKVPADNLLLFNEISPKKLLKTVPLNDRAASTNCRAHFLVSKVFINLCDPLRRFMQKVFPPKLLLQSVIIMEFRSKTPVRMARIRRQLSPYP